MNNQQLGQRGEDAAAAYVERVGMTIVERNWRCKTGEIDIIALDGTVLVLIEVKTRKGCTKGTPEDAVSPTKQKRLTRLARTYVAQTGAEEIGVRFDVISLLIIADDRALLRHHRAAFSAV